MSHTHGVYDTDARFVINPVTRQIKNESSKKTTLIQFDHNSERFTFEVPRHIEGHDMSICNKVDIHYINVDAKTKQEFKGVYFVDDLRIADDADDADVVICSWLIDGGATRLVGKLSFVVRFCCTEGTKVTYAWNTAVASVDVSTGIDASDAVVADYSDVLEKWKAELFNAGYINADTMQANIANLSGALDVERKRIDNIVKLPNGSTTGDAELVDIRVGADGVTYESAGAAVRTQIQKIKSFAESSIETGMVENTNVYVSNESRIGVADCTTQGMTPSQAYGNGTVFTNDVQVTGIKLLPTITAKTFSVFAFNSAGTLIESVESIMPIIKDGIFTLERPISVPGGGYMLVRFLDGVFFYKKTGTATLKEYQPGARVLIDSPIKIGIEYIYNDVHQSTAFKAETILPSIQLRDYDIPRFIAKPDEKYTYYGRWFDHDADGKTFKAANADGSSLAFRISGATKLNVGFYPITTPKITPYFAYSIDGSDFVRQKITNTTISIADKGEHWVWIVIDGMGENDPVPGGKWYGTVGVYFAGVSTDGTVNGADASNRQIMFVGDSIVEGINVLGAGANADTNSATNGFAFKTARLLNAIPLLCGYGGTAILGNSSFHKPIEAIDYNLNGIPANEQHPDIICIEHGYNDGTLVSGGTYTADDFKAGYNALLDRLALKHPGVQIVCVIPFKQSLRQEILDCVVGRRYCHVIETANWGITYTDSAHPDRSGASIASEKLATEILKLFGKQYFLN